MVMLTRLRREDRGASLMELVTGITVAMIGFALVATVLVGAQQQERVTDTTARTVDTARVALARIVNDVREARIVEMNGDDAVAWFDHDHDGERGAGEEITYGLRPDGSDQQLVRIVDGVAEPLATGLTGGSLSVALLANAYRLTISITVPGHGAHAGTTLTSEASTRGNL